MPPCSWRFELHLRVAVPCLLLAAAARPAAAQPARRQHSALEYTVSFPELATHFASVLARLPSGDRDSVELMMAVWSPGYYKVENYAEQVRDVAARTDAGAPLDVVHDAPNRWRVATHGAPAVIVTYRVLADRRFVTADWAGDSLIVLNGAPTFMTLAGNAHLPAVVRLELPAGWRSATSLDSVRNDHADTYRARDYDELVDSPIVAAGDLRIRDFTVGGSRHAVVDAGDVDGWNSDRAVRDIERFVNEDRRFWGRLPYTRYVFLNVFRPGGGGLEHRNSTLLTSNATRSSSDRAYLGWLNFVSHEYFHAMNVKRLRPVELGPFDYEGAPKTPSLWISEGLTTYYGDLMVARSGLAGDSAFLDWMSALIGQLQTTPGRLVQTLSQSSLDAWNSENSGVGMDQSRTVSYYTKGTVVGFLLDAHIRRLTRGRRSLDDVMRRAYARYSDAHGFTPGQFQRAASSVAGADLAAWFHRALDTTAELDYSGALAWYGLRFGGDTVGENAKQAWRLERRPDATAAQRAHLAALLAP